MKKELIELLQQLLNFSDKKEGKRIGKKIFELMSQEFELDINERGNIKTNHSEALNAYDSGYCVAYPTRTKKSLIATMNRLEKQDDSVLYIGTGPFAPYFLFPILLGSKAKFTLLEINPYAIKILKKVIERFNLEDFVIDIVKADATTWAVDQTYGTVLCETSDVGLRREDTLPIYKNLTSQLPNALFMPQDVIIMAGSGITNKSQPFDSLKEAIERGYLKKELPYKKEEQPFVQNRIILDEELTLEPYESVVTMPLFL